MGRPRLNLDVIVPLEVDWAQIMIDLSDKGCPSTRVARYVGASYAASENWAKGGEPGYAYGWAVLKLHRRMCGEELNDIRMKDTPQASSTIHSTIER